MATQKTAAKGKALVVCSTLPGKKSSRSFEQYFTDHFGHPEEWHVGKLPHRNKPGLVQSITFRLADSLPQSVLDQIATELQSLPPGERDKEQRKRFEYWMDQGLGCCALDRPEMAQVMLDALLHHHGDRYELIAWSIMPNHVHVLIHTNNDLSKIIQSWKSFTGKWALAHNRQYQLGIADVASHFWMAEYWDRFIRDAAHFDHTIRYILGNPEQAGLLGTSTAHRFTGCRLEEEGLKQELHPSQEGDEAGASSFPGGDKAGASSFPGGDKAGASSFPGG